MKKGVFISFCGDNCSECPRYIATQNNDTIRLQELARLWYRLGFRQETVSIEEIRCNGCSKTKPCSYDINTCEHVRDLNNCGECAHYPCAKISGVFARTDTVDEICRAKCSYEEYARLQKAFLMKRETLDEINIKFFKKWYQ